VISALKTGHLCGEDEPLHLRGPDAKQLLREFRKIDREIPTERGEKEMLVMANFLLGLEIDGCIIECGCYLGAVLPQCFS
jgi:hypothetical protein